MRSFRVRIWNGRSSRASSPAANFRPLANVVDGELIIAWAGSNDAVHAIQCTSRAHLSGCKPSDVQLSNKRTLRQSYESFEVRVFHVCRLLRTGLPKGRGCQSVLPTKRQREMTAARKSESKRDLVDWQFRLID
jgi:hypothetical protein